MKDELAAMRIARNRKTPRQILREKISNQIVSGKFSPGSELPSMSEFARMHSVSLATAKRVYNDLSAAGLIDCCRGAKARVHGVDKEHNKLIFMVNFLEFDYERGPWTMSWSQQVSAACERRNITLVPMSYQVLDQSRLLAVADGLIVDEAFPQKGDHLQKLSRLGKPFVALKNYYPSEHENNIIGIDYRIFFDKCLTYIHSCGIRKIIYIAGYSDLVGRDGSLCRHQMLQEIMRSRGCSDGEVQIFYPRDDGPVASRYKYEIIENIREPFAVICCGFWAAEEMLQRCLKKNLRPKKDFIIIESSGLPESAESTLQMSSVKLDFAALGEKMLQMLEAQWKSAVCKVRPETIPTSLTVRNT